MEVRSTSGQSPAKMQSFPPDLGYEIPTPSLSDTPAVIGGVSPSVSPTANGQEFPSTSGDSGYSTVEFTSPESDSLPEPGSSRLSGEEEGEEEDDEDDFSSTISDISGISDLSGIEEWRASGPLGWVQRQIRMGTDPRKVLAKFVSPEMFRSIAESTDDFTLWKMLINMISHHTSIQWRKKLSHINTLEDVVGLIRRSSKILVLTGAGVSVSCGIPDFRSTTGVYARLARDFPDLPDPHAMFDIRYFNKDPRPFFKFAREIYPGQFKPSPCHKFIRALETHGKLLRNYTQNIDTLEQVAGIERVVQCHGSFATATCTHCDRKVNAETVREDILSQRIPVCQVCVPEGAEQALLHLDNKFSGLVSRGVMKPDIVFFGEGLPPDFYEYMVQDRDQADLLLIIGSSLKVQPVALIPSGLPENVPQVLINREPLPDCKVDVELLGYADELVDHLCRALGDDWLELCWRDTPLTKIELAKPTTMAVTQNNVELDDVDVATTLLPVPECSRKRPATPPIESVSPQPAKIIRRDERICSSDSAILPNDTCPTTENDSLDAKDASSSDAWRDSRPVKARQMSSDSTRDSGIAESTDDSPAGYAHAARTLPENTYAFLPPNRYIFPGAELSAPRHRSFRCPSLDDLELMDDSIGSSSPSRDSSPSLPLPTSSDVSHCRDAPSVLPSIEEVTKHREHVTSSIQDAPSVLPSIGEVMKNREVTLQPH